MRGVLLLWLALAFQSSGASIEGQVVRVGTNDGIEYARILVGRIDRPAQSIVVQSDRSGHFVASGLTPGTYRLVAEADDHVRTAAASPFNVSQDQQVKGIRLELVPTAVITGRVLNESGIPASKVYVRALTSLVIAETQTNDLGEYRLFGLSPGTYVVSAERYRGPFVEESASGPNAGRGPVYVTPSPPSPDSPGEGRSTVSLASRLKAGAFVDALALAGEFYPPVFYQATTDRNRATTLEVAAGARISGIDLQLVIERR